MTGSGAWTPPPLVAGPIQWGNAPAQPEMTPRGVSWDAFDVPRMWEMLAGEAYVETADALGWVQVGGFAQLAQLLWLHHRGLKSRCAELGAAWQSPAGTQVVALAEAFADSLLSDATCAHETAHGLHGVLTALGEAKAEMWSLERRWNSVTDDWMPEWWDQAAAELNFHARNVMIRTDTAVGDHRKRILVPDASIAIDTAPRRRIDDDPDPTDAPGPSATGVPPVPGYDPLPSSATGGPELAGLPGSPSMVPAVPGAPVSMLPIPPGSPYAPYGGAYILPGPGVGKGGYVVPMPPPGSPSGRIGGMQSGFASGRAGGGGYAPGMMPMPIGTPMPNNAGGPGGGGYRRPNLAWQTDQGVPSVIDGLDDDLVIPDQPSEKQEEAFANWFAELAYPWRSESKDSSQPHVVLRKVTE